MKSSFINDEPILSLDLTGSQHTVLSGDTGARACSHLHGDEALVQSVVVRFRRCEISTLHDDWIAQFPVDQAQCERVCLALAAYRFPHLQELLGRSVDRP
ncbi:MAG: hypothetical protein ACJARS_004984 [bacterium]|jgi:hypothetical protein